MFCEFHESAFFVLQPYSLLWWISAHICVLFQRIKLKIKSDLYLVVVCVQKKK